MSLKKITNLNNLKESLKNFKFINKFGRRKKKYAFFAGLVAFAALNTGFTAEPTSELPAEPTTKVEETASINPSDEMKKLIDEESKNLPSGITVSANGSIALADNDSEKQLLTEVVNNTLANVEDVENMKGVAEGEAVEEPEFVDEIAEKNNVSGYSDTNSYDYDSQYASVMAMEATAYLPTDGNGAGITAMGIPATYGVAAVDPSVIPLGSRLYVPGYGEAIAADTGGAIYGYKIDLCMESYSEAMNFGRRTVTVYVLR
ncbi:MAG: 3D domain-containing protein [Selenomonadaceae bacterium]|nr:3D domain-containing protein [Selenomonadaceae bacterium]